MSVELPLSPGSYNDSYNRYLDAHGIVPEAVTPEIRQAALEVYSQELDEYKIALCGLSRLDSEALHRNPNWHLKNSEQEQRAA